MTELFITVLNMSIVASYVALAVIIVRLLLKKAPKIFSYALWAVVLFRLISPFSFESSFSLIPYNPETIPQEIIYMHNPGINSGNDLVNNAVNQIIQSSLPPVNPAESVNPLGILVDIATIVWLLGIVAFLCYGLVSFIRLKQRLSTSTIVYDNIFETDRIQTPFVLGFIKPRIYIPTNLPEKELDYILKHEQIHLKRKDYLIKPIAFLALILHWFNPLMWICYFLMIKDMEMSCDESVMRNTDSDIRGNYSKSLLTFSVKQSSMLSPLAFGESNVKSRIKNVLNYRKPAFWVKVVALIIVIILAISLISNNLTYDIPTIYINTENGQSAQAMIGTHGWDYGYKKVQADSPIPAEFKYTSSNTITVFVGQQMAVGNQKLVKDKKVPFTVESISCWNAADMSEISLSSDSIEFQNNNLYIDAPDEVGEYIYGLHLKYERGNVVYGFKVNVTKEAPMKGLELYVWKNKELTGNDNTYFSLLIGTNRLKEESEIYNFDIAVDSIEELNQLLAGYSDESELFIYQMNTVDFTKSEMNIIADQINFPFGNGMKAIGLWQNTPTSQNNFSDNIANLVEKNLEIITSSPLYSSRPGDYIDAHRNEYETILKQGDDALEYLLSQFETGNNNDLRGHIMMLLCKNLLGDRNNVTDETLLPQEWYNALSIIEETILPDFKYTGNDAIEKLVYVTEIEQNKNPYRGGFIVVAPKIHDYYEEGNKLKVFVTTYYGSYHLYDKVLSLDSAGVVPSAITYIKNKDGSYSLEKYEQAMDGSYFAKSIKDYCTMPVSGEKIDGLADKIINYYGDYSEIITLQRENLIQHLKANSHFGINLKSPTGVIEILT